MMNKMLEEDHFLLGSFATNAYGGLTFTKVPERWNNSWENNLKLAKMLDEAGLDFMLPIARWVGYDGELDFHGSVLETVTWATGLVQNTENITVFATVQTAANNPVVLAKQIATIDQMAPGRIGLNVVAGWNKPEYEALGLTLPDDHDTRYGYAQEWFDIIKKLWTEEKYFNWNGKYFNLKRVKGDPRPSSHVPILNAGGSMQGKEFAINNVDLLFTTLVDLNKSKAEIAELKKQAARRGRDINVLTLCHVICRPTEQEAKEYLQYSIKENADWKSLDKLLHLQLTHAESFPKDQWELIREQVSIGLGGYPLIGTPEQVAEGLCSLAEAGFKGTTLSFVNYIEEFPYFRDNVLPILEAKGVRLKKSSFESA